MGFTPKYCQIILKRCIIYSLGMVDSIEEEDNGNQSEKREKESHVLK